MKCPLLDSVNVEDGGDPVRVLVSLSCIWLWLLVEVGHTTAAGTVLVGRMLSAEDTK
jgi:hypothetical protein